MAFEPRQFDEHGLPIPQRFADNRPPDDEAPQRPKISPSAKRWVVLVLLVGIIVPIIFGPRIISAGRETLARWLSSRAETKLLEGDKRGALADLNQAISWDPEAWRPYHLRANIRQEQNELDASLADFTKAIDLLDSQDKAGRRRWRGIDRLENLAILHVQRSWVHVRLSQGRDAIDDATDAVNLLRCPTTLNARAYARAVLNMELKEGLDDIDQALANPTLNDADYRDTRGYLLHLLDRNDKALVELDRAIKATERKRDEAVFRQNLFGRQDQRDLDQGLAVMYHHRGQVHQKLEHKEQAEADLQLANQLGYNQANGVF